MPRRIRPIDRTANPVRDANLIVIASEDQHAVRQYFEFFPRISRVQFIVLETQDGKSSPKHLLERIDSYMKEYEMGAGDQFWLMCDCDHWIERNHISNMNIVLSECRKKGVKAAISHPCFEIWLLLHFKDHPSRPNLKCPDICKGIVDPPLKYNKDAVYKLLITHQGLQSALQRASSRPVPHTTIPNEYQTSVYHIVKDLVDRKLVTI